MGKQRIWLDRGEWNCCGEPFAVGDHVTFRTDPRTEALATLLGDELSPSVDRQESHHEDGGREEVAGTVVAVWAAIFDYQERRVSREVPPPAPPFPSPANQPEAGWFAIRGPVPPYVVVGEVIPGTARLSAIPRVPWPPRESEPTFDGTLAPAGLAGYLVDLDLP